MLIEFETILPSQIEFSHLDLMGRLYWAQLQDAYSVMNTAKNAAAPSSIIQHELDQTLDWIRSNAPPTCKADIFTFNLACTYLDIDPSYARKAFLRFWHHGTAGAVSFSDDDLRAAVFAFIKAHPGVHRTQVCRNVRGGMKRITDTMNRLTEQGVLRVVRGKSRRGYAAMLMFPVEKKGAEMEVEHGPRAA